MHCLQTLGQHLSLLKMYLELNNDYYYYDYY